MPPLHCPSALLQVSGISWKGVCTLAWPPNFCVCPLENTSRSPGSGGQWGQYLCVHRTGTNRESVLFQLPHPLRAAERLGAQSFCERGLLAYLLSCKPMGRLIKRTSQAAVIFSRELRGWVQSEHSSPAMLSGVMSEAPEPHLWPSRPQ